MRTEVSSQIDSRRYYLLVQDLENNQLGYLSGGIQRTPEE